MSKHIRQEVRVAIDENNPAIVRDEDLCVECRLCAGICNEYVGVNNAYDLAKTGGRSVCIHCGQCIPVCPTNSLQIKSSCDAVRKAVADPDKIVIFSTSPSVRVALGDAFGMADGAFVEGQMVELLRRLGGDYVLDTNFAADLTICEEAAELIERIKAKGVDWETVHLEVGLDTFRIVDEEFPKDHQIHTERYTVPEKTVEAIKHTKANGGRVIAIGTTSVRSLESAWDAEAGEVLPRDREATSLFILPGYEFHVVDAMVTNFHVPRSTLMMLVSAFSSRDNIMKAYRHAIKHKYRMLSFGDAMFIE